LETRSIHKFNLRIEVTQDEFVPEDDLKTHLRHVTQGELLVRSEFDGFVRRGLIEPKSKSNKLSKAKVPLFKVKEK
jgi:nucleolar protein 53